MLRLPDLILCKYHNVRKGELGCTSESDTHKIIPGAPNGEKVIPVSTSPKQLSVVQSVSQPVVQSVPKPNVESVPNSSVSSTKNGAGSASVKIQNSNSAPKLVLRKDQESVQMDNTSVLWTLGIGHTGVPDLGLVLEFRCEFKILLRTY